MFVVVDSIDGGGSETQSNLLLENLQDKNIPVTIFRYPNYENAAGQIIRKFLYENEKLSVEKQFLLYTLQFVFDSEKINEASEKGIVIADRYFSTTLCFQTLEGFDEKKALSFADDFGIIKPNAILYLDVAPETALKWKHGEGKELNFREKDFAFMQRTYDQFEDLAKRNVWADWKVITGERSKGDVAEDILEQVLEMYGKKTTS